MQDIASLVCSSTKYIINTNFKLKIVNLLTNLSPMHETDIIPKTLFQMFKSK